MWRLVVRVYMYEHTNICIFDYIYIHETNRHVEDFNVEMSSKGISSFVSSEMFEAAGHGDLVFDEVFRDR
jgi:hypothetical protein